MDFSTYQAESLMTDQAPGVAVDENGELTSEAKTALLVPLLGLAGEAGELLSEYKKHLRDGAAHRLFRDRVAEELGDLLWYVTNMASKCGLALDDIAVRNLAKTRDRWTGMQAVTTADFDDGITELEQLPKLCEVQLSDNQIGKGVVMRATVDGIPLGDPLTDNADIADGYRFHDVFHLAYAAVLGWSPVTRANLKRKRKSDERIDEVEDGGRATAIEEGIAALVFSYARDRSFLEGVHSVDYDLLRTVKGMTSHLEVAARTAGEWEAAILQGYEVFRAVLANGGGKIRVDREARRITFLGPVGSGNSGIGMGPRLVQDG